MRQIFFKKQLLGKWRRDDGESKKEVNEESMFRELHKLANDGWHIEPHGVTHVRAIAATSPEQPRSISSMTRKDSSDNAALEE